MIRHHPYLPGIGADNDGGIWSRRRGDTWIPRSTRQGTPYGHLRVTIWTPGVPQPQRVYWVHRLVCEAWHGEAPEGKPIVRHMDGNARNNRPSNLRWGSEEENAEDRERDRRDREAEGVSLDDIPF